MLDHKHLIVNAKLYSNSPVVKSYYTEDVVFSMECWLRDLVNLVGMKVFMEPIVKTCDEKGNEGITGVIGLETSHASFHIWTNGDFRFDLYSCQDFDVNQVIDHIEKLGLIRGNYITVDRNSEYITYSDVKFGVI